jgi:hypothetical protein
VENWNLPSKRGRLQCLQDVEAHCDNQVANFIQRGK